MKSTVEVLREARALYEANPSHAPAGECPPEGAVCLIWALDKAVRPVGVGVGAAYAAIHRAVQTTSLVDWNATHTTEEVLAAFDRAIEAEEAKS